MNHNMIDVCDELWMLLKTLIEAHRVAVAEDRPL